ncbi:sec-independent translocase [Streptomyces sp. NPDC048565]|uniref:sec-independent translocase n=1 Tax=Streptomyces sp. NPDC048565 TaxID=3155266 RepID=UPI00343FCAD3
MFADVGVLELVTLVILALVLFGPDKLPEAIRTVSAVMRKFREFSETAKHEVRSGLGPEFEDFEFEDLDPRTFVRKHVLDSDGLALDEIRHALDPRPELKEVMSDAFDAEPVSLRKDGDRAVAGRPSVDPDAT